MGYFVYQIQKNSRKLKVVREHYAAQSVDKNCPRTQFKSGYECFRALEKSTIDSARDSTSMIILMSIGVMIVQRDKSESLVTPAEARLNLADFLLDLEDGLLARGVPSRFSPSVADFIERKGQGKMARGLLKTLDSMMVEVQRRNPVAQPSLDPRILSTVARYGLMRPKLVDQSEN